MITTYATRQVPQIIQVHKLAQVRHDVYSFCLQAMDKPTRAKYDWLNSKPFRASLRSLCEQFGVSLPAMITLPQDFAAYECVYIACFDVGLPTPPVPLLSSHYNKREPVPATIHEHVLFYKRFGTTLSEANIEPADHLSNELAFLIWLDELLHEGEIDPESIHQARLDFLSRHPHRWLPQALHAAQEKELPELFIVLLRLMIYAVEEDVELTQSLLSDLHEKDNGI
ncbi:MAG TPA: molecular chaperone TorD family protein [Gemmatales bacterium]|nr:molecular chaperone TorD family protein [Gemmatales bacterium]